MAKIIAVFGATGMQGGAVVTALLKNKNFEVRGVTRNANSDKAKALEKRGVKVVEGNLDDPNSLSKALSGCYGVFGVTNYWEASDANKEIQQGKNLVDACKASGVKHLIFSGLEDIKGKLGKPCPHFDSKGEIEKYMFASGVPSTSVRFPFYMENFLLWVKDTAQKDNAGAFLIGIPMEGKPIYMAAVPGAGNAIGAVFASPDAYMGKTVGLAGDKKTVEEMCEILNNILAPKTFKASPVTAEEYSKYPFPGAEDLGAMFQYYQLDGVMERDVELTKKLDPTTLNFEDWVKENKDALNAAFQ